MAETKKPIKEENVEVVPEHPEYVRIRLPKDRNENKSPAMVGINGVMYAIPRGVEVSVPYKVYATLKDAEMQNAHTEELISSLTSQN